MVLLHCCPTSGRYIESLAMAKILRLKKFWTDLPTVSSSSLATGNRTFFGADLVQWLHIVQCYDCGLAACTTENRQLSLTNSVKEHWWQFPSWPLSCWRHDCWAKIAFLTKITSWSPHNIQSQSDRLVENVWKNFVGKLLISPSKLFSCIDFLYKIVQKIGRFSKYVFFVPSRARNWSQERIAGKRSNLAQLIIKTLFPKLVLGIFEIRSPSHFFNAFFHKKKITLNFANMKCSVLYLEN